MYIQYFKNEQTGEFFISHDPKYNKQVGVGGWRYATEQEIEEHNNWTVEEILKREG